MLFKAKISLDDLCNTYIGVINYIYNQFNFNIDNIHKYSLLLDLYCFLYFGSISGLEKLLTSEQAENFENKIIATIFNDINALNKIDLEKLKNFNWDFFSKENGTLLFLYYKLDELNVAYTEDTLHSYAFLMLNNLNGMNLYLKTIKIDKS